MKRIIAVAALLAATSFFALAQTPDTQTKPAAENAGPAGAEQELTRLTDQYTAALKGKDASALERLTPIGRADFEVGAPDHLFAVINSAGEAYPRLTRTVDDVKVNPLSPTPGKA